MQKNIVIKVECENPNVYDVMSLYRVVDGTNGYTITISSSKGTTFKSNSGLEITTTCICTVYKGSMEIEPKSYTWVYIENDGTTWTTVGTGKSIDFPISSTVVRKRLKCIVEI